MCHLLTRMGTNAASVKREPAAWLEHAPDLLQGLAPAEPSERQRASLRRVNGPPHHGFRPKAVIRA